jgi:hypothetical protein
VSPIDSLTQRSGRIRELASIIHPFKVSPTAKEHWS